MRTETFFARLHETIEEERKRWDLPGISYGVVKNGEILYEDFAGYLDMETQKIANRETLYMIGSVSKSFTAAGIALLVQRRKLSFDDPVKTYLPWFRLGDEKNSGMVTIRDLLCHRTGIGRHDEEWIPYSYSRKELVELLGRWELEWEPRTHWEYQNLCYVALGMVIESIMGTSWEEFIETEFLKPLGMNQTGFFLEELMQNINHALPYDRPGIVRCPYFLFPLENKEKGVHAPHGPAGSIYSNMKDMEKWLNFQLGYSRGHILSEEMFSEMHRCQMKMEEPLYLNGPELTAPGYGMGWFCMRYKGIAIVEHGGNVPGYGCLAMMAPDLRLGIIVHLNLCDTTFGYAIGYEIVDHFLGIQGGNWFEREWEYMKQKR